MTSRWAKIWFATSCLVALHSTIIVYPADASDFSKNLSLSADLQWFPQDAKYPDQDHDTLTSISAELDLEWERGPIQARGVFYGLLSPDLSDRNYYDIRELYWRRNIYSTMVTVGIDRVFWGVAESNHLVNVINQVDSRANLDGDEVLGQPMLRISQIRAWGEIEAFLLAGYRARSYRSKKERLRFSPPVEFAKDDTPAWKHKDEVDWAVRYSNSYDDVDFGVSFFKGVGRQARLLFNSSEYEFDTRYDHIEQSGADLQWTMDALLLKFEGIYRRGQGKSFLATVFGLEYTFFSVNESSGDIGFILEYQKDNRDTDISVAPPTIHQDDLFFGIRASLNNSQDTTFLFGLDRDLDFDSTIVKIEAETRLSSGLVLTVDSRYFNNTSKDLIINNFTRDHYIQLSVTKYF
jgi:hypothetical protein